MLARLRDQIVICEEEATLAHFKSLLATTPQMRHEYQRLEGSWLQLANSLDFAVMIDGYLEWTSRRLAPPPQ